MRRAILCIASGAVLALFAAATPAWAHVEFDQASAPPNSHQTFTFHVPVEQAGHNAKITVDVPKDFVVHSCSAEPGWGCAVSYGSPVTVTWTRGDAPAATEDDVSFLGHTPQAEGDYAFVVHQTYSDGATADWAGPESSANPAPVFKVSKSAPSAGCHMPGDAGDHGGAAPHDDHSMTAMHNDTPPPVDSGTAPPACETAAPTCPAPSDSRHEAAPSEGDHMTTQGASATPAHTDPAPGGAAPADQPCGDDDQDGSHHHGDHRHHHHHHSDHH